MDPIAVFTFQMAIVMLVVNALVNVFKPFWQDSEHQDKFDLGFGFAFSIALCLVLRVDGFNLLLSFAFPQAAMTVPWYVGAVLTGLLGEKLAAMLNDIPKGAAPKF